jgi:hypothetical protein
MKDPEKELIQSIRNSNDPVKTFEFALTLIFENLQTPLPSEPQALVCQVASS